jgi:hypothetical protein
MLKMASKKIMLLLGTVMALCAFLLPSVASATSWSPVGTTDGRIDSSNLGFSSPALGVGIFCSSTTLSVSVDSGALATITGADFANCHGNVGSFVVGCTVTYPATNLPWRVTPVNTTNIDIHGVDIDLTFETTPGTLGECANTGLTMRLTGTLSASFTPGPPRVFDFTGSTALLAHIPNFATVPFVLRGTGTTTGLLNVIM